MTSLLLAAVFLIGTDTPTTRSLSVKNIPAESRKDYVKVTSFALNMVSKNRTVTMARLDGDYIKFDLEDYKIDPKVFDGLKHPYKEMRADWFIINAMVAPTYYKLLGVNDLDSFKKLVSYDKKSLQLQEAGLVVQSNVARNNRILKRTPTVTGYVWESHDVLRSIDDRDYLRNLLSDKYDSLEMLGTLPNGLQAYFAADSKGTALDYLDSTIAIDNNFDDRLVRVGRSCVVCHSKGVQPFDDTVRRLTHKDLGLRAKDSQTAKLLTNLFGSRIGESVKRDQRAYNKSVRKLGMGPYFASKKLKQVYLDYNKQVTLETAAKELNVSKDRLVTACKLSNDPHLLGLLLDRPMRRDRWEEVYKLVLGLASK